MKQRHRIGTGGGSHIRFHLPRRAIKLHRRDGFPKPHSSCTKSLSSKVRNFVCLGTRRFVPVLQNPPSFPFPLSAYLTCPLLPKDSGRTFVFY
jgi:hypothetical protein